MSSKKTKPNRLIRESSPYLKQHAYNPVDWYPWGEEALEKARKENKLIFLSIGYSSCHWCHVMEHESFEDEKTAEYMNQHFVNIKVDREERPDIDMTYMEAVQMISGHGGWPLSVWLTPTLIPVFGGTYFPPTPKYERPSFMMIMKRIEEVFRNEPDKVFQQSGKMLEALQSEILDHIETDDSIIDWGKIELNFARSFEQDYGGFSQSPKFPMAMTLRLILMLCKAKDSTSARSMLTTTLNAMMNGGIWDHIGGGFARYSVDKTWTVPHFEKMLYDNALLLHVYFEASQAFSVPEYAEIAKGIDSFLQREMKHENGLYYSALDADSEGEEGKFYVWTFEDLKAILSEEEWEFARRYWEIDEAGNFEGNIIPRFRDHIKGMIALSEDQKALYVQIGQKLLEKRSQRIRPGLDYKSICSWNAMLLNSYTTCARSGDNIWIDRTLELADAMLKHFWDGKHCYRIYAQQERKQHGFLDDYGLFVSALVSTFEVSSEQRYLDAAVQIAETMLEYFYEADGKFLYTSKTEEIIIRRRSDIFDNAAPGGFSSALSAILKLSRFTGDQKWQHVFSAMKTRISRTAQNHPLSLSNSLQVLLELEFGEREIIVVGEEFSNFRQVWAKNYDPFSIFMCMKTNTSELPLLRGKTPDHTAAYVCRSFHCEAPVYSIAEFEERINEA